MRAVLIVIADAANSDGEHSHPGLDNIIDGSLYSRAHVLATLSKLEAEQWIIVVGKRSPGRATTFNVVMDRPDQEVQPLDLFDDGRGPIGDGQRSNPGGSEVQSSGPDTSSCVLATVSTTVSTTAPSTARARDVVFEAIAEACGIDWTSGSLTGTARGMLNKAARELRAVDATPEEIDLRTRRFVARYRGATPTPMAIVKHWPQLGNATPTAPRAEPRGMGAARRLAGVEIQ